MLAPCLTGRPNLRWRIPPTFRRTPNKPLLVNPGRYICRQPKKTFFVVNKAQISEDTITKTVDADIENSLLLLEKVQSLDPAVKEGLLPLAEALQKAVDRKARAQGFKETVEAEAQEVAQLAVSSEESKAQADGELQEAEEALEELKKEKESQNVTLERLHKKLIEFRAILAQKTLQPTDNGSQQQQQQQQQQKQDADVEATVLRELDVENMGDPQTVINKIQAKIEDVQNKILQIDVKIQEAQDQIVNLKIAVEEAANNFTKSENMVIAAMTEAENATRTEMDATAILQQTEKALLNALQGLKIDIETLVKQPEEPQIVSEDERLSFLDSKDGWEDVVISEDELEEEQDLIEPEEEVTEKKEAKADTKKEVQVEPWYATNFAKIVGAGVGVLAIGLILVNHTLIGKTVAGWIQAFPSAFGELVKQIGPEEMPGEIKGLLETIVLLLTSVIFVPLVVKLLPGGSPVLGFLVGGAVIGPHGLGIINNVEQVKHLAELGIVLLLFNIGLELSLERLQALGKFVFGLGFGQVLITTLAIAGVATLVGNLHGAASIILGGALSLSTTAVAMQVLQDRGESGSRHGRATFSVLLFQDLAVVVLLMLIPLLAPQEHGSGGFARIAKALALAGIKAVVCIVGIIVGGRILVRPLYRKVSAFENPDVFAATTLLMVLGTSVLTQIAGLSLALGAFLAGLLLAETEYSLQVESDIAPYKGLLMGLFFMTVGMEISMSLLFAKWQIIFISMVVLLMGKTAIMGALGVLFGLSRLASLRAGLLLASGGEFAFVALGDAVARGVIPAAVSQEMFMVVILSMAMVPYLAEIGSSLGKVFETQDVSSLQPHEGETKDLRDHVIICGFGRIGQIVAQLLSERMIQFVALDVRSDRVAAGKKADLPVYFGDAGSEQVLRHLGASRAKCAVVTLDTPQANYRSVWTINNYFPDLPIYVRAHDLQHVQNLEKAGANVVVPETLEPSLQLASQVLGSMNVPPDELDEIISDFRRSHLAELQGLANSSQSSLGYGYGSKSKDKEKEKGGKEKSKKDSGVKSDQQQQQQQQQHEQDGVDVTPALA